MPHSIDKTVLLSNLQTDQSHGLSTAEANARVARNGQNIVKKQKPLSEFKRFMLQFHSPLIYILLASGVIALYLGEFVDSSVIFGVVILNAIIGYVQEAKAQKAILALNDMIVTMSTVLRDGEKQIIDARFLTVGDIVILSSGDKVPADMRLVDVSNLAIDESILTGESLSVSKEDTNLPSQTSIADRVNMCFAGSLVTYGRGRGVVVSTGDNTEVGKIASLLQSTQKLETPLLKKVSELGGLILIVVVALSLMTVFIGIARGESLADMLMASVALAVGAIPEGLPAAMTIMLAVGVSAMASKNAIIRTLASVETLGSATVICSDKTGTLTKNEMTVQKIYDGTNIYEVSGTGYESNGEIIGAAPLGESAIWLLTIGMLCNDSGTKTKDGKSHAVGDPTEAALIVCAQKANLDKAQLQMKYPRIDTLAFESDRQLMATLHVVDGKNILLVKGGVEKIHELCKNSEGFETAHGLARDGFRVLAFASKELSTDVTKITDELLESCEFAGYQAMIDPPRPEAKDAVSVCKSAGISVKMITGDHIETAKNIAAKLGICTPDSRAISGAEIEKMSDEELGVGVKEASVFARVSPQQKLRLVCALQQNGEVVAMTGDGVNDAPALKRSDIGIAMGKSGTDVSIEAADVVLADDNFASIVAAVEEGRNIYEKFIKFIIWSLPTNIGEGLVIFFAVLAGSALPMLPVQVLWLNMTSAVFLGLMLVFEPNEKEVMNRKPRDGTAYVISGDMLFRMLLSGTIMLIGSFFMFEFELSRGHSEEYARTVAVTVFIVIETFYLFNCRSLYGSVFKMNIFTNRPLLIGIATMALMQAAFIYAPFMNRLFSTEAIGADSFAYMLLFGIATLLIIEMHKKVIFRRKMI